MDWPVMGRNQGYGYGHQHENKILPALHYMNQHIPSDILKYPT